MVKLVNQTGQKLPDAVKEVLQAMFADYHQVIIRPRFEGGFSGSLVYPVRPAGTGGVELPSVVKIDYKERIQQEWTAYRTHIQRRLPHVAEIQGEPVIPEKGSHGGLWYPLAGAGSYPVESFRQYYQRATAEEICAVLNKQLFKSLASLWQQTTFQPYLQGQTAYDSVLPPNLFIEGNQVPVNVSIEQLSAETAGHQAYRVGDYVELEGFYVARLDRKKPGLFLDTTPNPPGSYRLFFSPVPDPAAYQLGQQIGEKLVGIVCETRSGQLQMYTEKALGSGIDLSATTLSLVNGRRLPNPLLGLPRLLNRSFDARIGPVHGDLNLENILIEPESGNVYLIDFAQSRLDHILHDLLHLEMGLVIKLLPQALAQAQLAPEAVCSFYEQLHCAVINSGSVTPPIGLEKPFAVLLTIRQTARRYLLDTDDWSEYYTGLVPYLLGTLKYDDLDEKPMAHWRPKEVIFWGAASLLHLLDTQIPCNQIAADTKQRTKDVTPSQSEPQGSTTTHFHGPVTGTIHTGSGDIQLTNNVLDTETKTRYRDTFSSYEIGVQRLLVQIGRKHPRYLEALGYQGRLRDNVDRSRRFGDTSSRRADRAEIVEQLNELSLSVTGISFNEFCQGTG